MDVPFLRDDFAPPLPVMVEAVNFQESRCGTLIHLSADRDFKRST